MDPPGFLLAVSLLPFSTGLLAEFVMLRSALVVYWLNLVLLGGMLWTSVRYAWRAQLVKDGLDVAQWQVHERRIGMYQALYALAVALCVINTFVSIALLVLLQLHSVLALRLRPLDRF